MLHTYRKHNNTFAYERVAWKLFRVVALPVQVLTITYRYNSRALIEKRSMRWLMCAWMKAYILKVPLYARRVDKQHQFKFACLLRIRQINTYNICIYSWLNRILKLFIRDLMLYLWCVRFQLATYDCIFVVLSKHSIIYFSVYTFHYIYVRLLLFGNWNLFEKKITLDTSWIHKKKKKWING